MSERGNVGRGSQGLSRRGFVVATAAAATGVSVLGASEAHAAPPRWPFELGVASGEPASDGVVLWTRLAPDPVAADGRGGMPARPVRVRWEVAEDDRFLRRVRRGTTWAVPDSAHSVHVEVNGLRSSSTYYYRFEAERHLSPVGRTRTLPAAGSRVASMSFAVVSCQSYPTGYFTAYRHVAEEDLDLVFHLGDYIYDTGASDQPVGGRQHVPSRRCKTLTDYRIRHSLYKTDRDLQSVHARFPMVVTWDDGEVTNNYADDQVPDQTPEEFLRQRAAAYRAFYENMPLRASARPDGPDMLLHRRFEFGDLAGFNVLDTRQHRDDQPCVERVAPPCPEQRDPRRSILGGRQERWLFDNLKASGCTWELLAQQVFFAQRDLAMTRDLPPSETLYAMDKWDGYVASRNRVLEVVEQRDLTSFVVLSGDDHVNWACDVKKDFDDPGSKTLATEFVATSISSGGDLSVPDEYAEATLTENPHIRYCNAHRGYVRGVLDHDGLRASYRTIPYVTRPDAPVTADAEFLVSPDRPGLHRVT